MKRSELEKCLGKKVEVHLKKDVEDSKHVYVGMLTKCSSLTPERNLYYCKGDFCMEVRFRSSYVQKIVEV